MGEQGKVRWQQWLQTISVPPPAALREVPELNTAPASASSDTTEAAAFDAFLGAQGKRGSRP